ncbi:DUF5999 family protein [Streptomyces mediolani]|uniref:DUF5999 family protein n=1 Tax=Streptomyces albovinaceus subgroup TaxID=1482558 RepID=UPI00131DC363
MIIYRPAATRSGEVQRRELLCNGVLLFEDTGQLLPDGSILAPCRGQFAGAEMQRSA